MNNVNDFKGLYDAYSSLISPKFIPRAGVLANSLHRLDEREVRLAGRAVAEAILSCVKSHGLNPIVLQCRELSDRWDTVSAQALARESWDLAHKTPAFKSIMHACTHKFHGREIKNKEYHLTQERACLSPSAKLRSCGCRTCRAWASSLAEKWYSCTEEANSRFQATKVILESFRSACL